MEGGGANGPAAPIPEFEGWWEAEGRPPTSRYSAGAAGWSRDDDSYRGDDPYGEEPGEERHRWMWAKSTDEARTNDWGSWDETLRGVTRRRWRDFSWLAAGPLLDSINDQIAKGIHDLVNDRRQRWIAAQRAAGKADGDFVCTAPATKRNFLIMGDPGEIDGSQYSVVPPLLAVDKKHDTDFMLVVSDIIYPAGDVNDYVNGFYVPYQGYKKPIYALPGNHDWYDGLVGFMFHFCGAEALSDLPFRRSSYTVPENVARWLWRKSARPERARLLAQRFKRLPDKRDAFEPVQPAPYFALDVGPKLRLVSIDTGILGTIDREQGEWLIRVSREPGKAKVLVTGKPLWVDGKYHPCEIELGDDQPQPDGYANVDDIVRDPINGYVASIGGDIHNYQRYSTTVVDERKEERGPSERPITYIVSGGAGAFMSATHRIGKIDAENQDDRPDTVNPIEEKDFLCYPTRGDSLAYYARWFGRRVAATTFVTSVLAGAIVVALLAAWGNEIDGRSIGSVFGVAMTAFLAVLVAGLAIVGIIMLTPRGYKFAVTALSVPFVVLVVGWLMRLAFHDDVWHWVWPTVLLTLGASLLPLVVVLVFYYGLGSSGKPPEDLYLLRALMLGVLILAEIVVIHLIPNSAFDSWADVAIALPLALFGLAVFVWIVARLKPVLGTVGHFVARRWWLNGPASGLAYLALVGLPIAFNWDRWWVQTAVVGAGAFWILVTALLLGLLAWTRGLPRPVWWLRAGRLDPAEAHRYLVDMDCRKETADRRIADAASRRTRKIARFLAHPLMGKIVSEAGNADEPPMFKNFLHAELLGADGDETLRLTCYGVSGWKAHETPAGAVAVEDRVDIDLTAVPDG